MVGCWFLNVLLHPGAWLRVWQLPFPSTSQRHWWQNTAMSQMAEGNRTGQRKMVSVLKPLRKGLEGQDERQGCWLQLLCVLQQGKQGWGMRESSQTAEPHSWKSDVCTAERSLCQRSSNSSGRDSSEGLKESLTHAEGSSNVQVKMMTVLNTEVRCQ